MGSWLTLFVGLGFGGASVGFGCVGDLDICSCTEATWARDGRIGLSVAGDGHSSAIWAVLRLIAQGQWNQFTGASPPSLLVGSCFSRLLAWLGT
jgi:hypothetical protein